MKQIKILKFDLTLIPLIMSGEKTSTWRLFDDKHLSKGDIFTITESGTNTSYGNAQITEVIEKQLGELTDEDKKGHEQFASLEEMYTTYQTYYQKPVSPNTLVKIIRFKHI